MQIHERTFERHLGPEDVVDVHLIRRGARIIDFSVNFRTHIDGAWRTVVRYDTNHGQRLHVHRFWRKPDEQVEWLEARRSEDYGRAATHAIDEIQAHWQRHRRLVRRRQ